MPIKISRSSVTTVQFSTPQEIIISHLDDSIKIGDGTDFLSINADGSINSVVTASNLDIRDIDATQDNIAISDGTDQLEINSDGSINNKNFEAPIENIVYQGAALKSGSTENMNVNGSVTPVNFDFNVPSGQTIYLEGIYFLIQDPGTSDPNDFGSIATGLTNGLSINITAIGTSYELFNIKNNTHSTMLFSDNGKTVDHGGSGWLNSNDSFFGGCRFNKPIRMTQSTSDLVRVIVRDDLSSIDFCSMMIKYWRVI